MAKVIKVAIIEDEALVRENVSLFLKQDQRFELVLDSYSVENFLEKLPMIPKKPAVVILDIRLPGMDGLEGIRYIRQELPDADIVMLTAFDDSDRIFKALCAGAVSYISKKTDLHTIAQALVTVHEGGSFMSPSVARKVIDYLSPGQNTGIVGVGVSEENDKELTARQTQIVQGLVDGLSYKMIADKLLISVETVRDHIKKIYKKLEVNSRGEVVKIVLNGQK